MTRSQSGMRRTSPLRRRTTKPVRSPSAAPPAAVTSTGREPGTATVAGTEIEAPAALCSSSTVTAQRPAPPPASASWTVVAASAAPSLTSSSPRPRRGGGGEDERRRGSREIDEAAALPVLELACTVLALVAHTGFPVRTAPTSPARPSRPGGARRGGPRRPPRAGAAMLVPDSELEAGAGEGREDRRRPGRSRRASRRSPTGRRPGRGERGDHARARSAAATVMARGAEPGEPTEPRPSSA